MILAWMLILATPACVATGPHEFICQTHEQCAGVLATMQGSCLSDIKGDVPWPVLHRRPAPMGYSVKMNAPECRSNAHPHLRSMDTSRPDVKGAALPKPDGKCHLDKSDAVEKFGTATRW